MTEGLYFELPDEPDPDEGIADYGEPGHNLTQVRRVSSSDSAQSGDDPS